MACWLIPQVRRAAGRGIMATRVAPLGKWVGKERRKHVRLPEQVGAVWLA